MKIIPNISIRHKFISKSFTDNYQTNHAILSIIPYPPEVLFVGTFNPEIPDGNFADFPFGRNYLLPAFKKLKNPNFIFKNERRMPLRGKPKLINPNLPEVLALCDHFKMTFADLILSVNLGLTGKEAFLPNGNILINGREFNLKKDEKENGIFGLADLGIENKIRWNTQNIIEYLINTPSIKHIYLTRKPTGIWKLQWNLIVNHPELQNRNFTNIFPPNGRGRVERIAPPFDSVQKKILHYWIWNNLNHPTHPVTNENMGHLDHEWLIRHGVDINLF